MHSDTRPFSCSHCKDTFKSNHNLKLHIRVHTDDKPYVCKECDMKFRQIPHLKGHAKTHHSSNAFLDSFRCQLCEKSYRHKHMIKYHMEAEHQDKTYSCEKCNFTSKTQHIGKSSQPDVDKI